MRFGPRDTPSPEPGETAAPEPGDRRTTPPPPPHPGDRHVAGLRYNNDPSSGSNPTPEPVPQPTPAPPPEPIPQPTPEPGPPGPAPADWVPVQGTSRPEDLTTPEPPPPPAPPAPSVTVPDIPLPQEPPRPVDVPASWRAPEPPADPGPMNDPERRRTLVDAFVAEFVASVTWRATLAVLEGAFPGLGMAATLSRRTDELWRTIDTLDAVGATGLGVPAWLDHAGMAFDLSARLPLRPRPADPGAQARPRASWPYAGAFVIDTLDPLRYHRPVGGPLAPRDLTPEGTPAPPGAQTPPPGEEDDSGVVIVADLATAGRRVLDSAALWRYAGRVVTATLHDPLHPETRTQTRRALRALRRVVLIDPGLGLGLCLQIDVARSPRCLLAFHVDRDNPQTPHFVRP
ncbi:hypothetical protein [Actinomadura rugatobispora]|uniref:Uncharacterized protein n=1 Tax=Actinomadura rugatobispora TaxID=1994 RepID=A0ABW1ACN4_9ACTN|nr:hypothetical protein GCM10010200_030690 [Actinomadura rugatobispora]